MKERRPGLLNILTRGLACALILTGILYSGLFLLLPERFRYPLSALEGQILFFGGMSSILVAATLTYTVVRKLSVRLRRKGFKDFGLLRWWVQFLQSHHTIFGWAALTTAAAHATYFAVLSPGGSAHAIASWVALGAMAPLAAAGALVSRASRKGSSANKARSYRRVYGALAGLFVVVLSFHAAVPAVVLALWILITIPTALVWRKRRLDRNMDGRKPVPEKRSGTIPAVEKEY